MSISGDGSVLAWEGEGFSGQRSVYVRTYVDTRASFSQIRLAQPLDQIQPRIIGDGLFVGLVQVQTDGQRHVLRVDLANRTVDVAYRSLLAVGSPSVADGGAHLTSDARYLVFTLERLGELDLAGADVFTRDLLTGTQARLTSYAASEVLHRSPYWATAIAPSPPPPTIASLHVVGERVNPGVPVTVVWSVADANDVTIEGPGLVGAVSVASVGSLEVVPPTVDATYTVRAINDVGIVEQSVVASRGVPAFSVLIAGQSNAKGINVSASEALAFITAAAGVKMLGNDYVWKPAFEPTGDCVGHVDLVSADPAGGCTAFAQNNSGVSPGVSLANGVAAATGGEVFIVPAAKHGSALNGSQANDNWQPGFDRYDRETLFGSAAYRAQRSGIDRGAPLGSTFAGARYGAVLWYQGTSNTSSVSQTEAFFGLTDTVLAAFARSRATVGTSSRTRTRIRLDVRASSARTVSAESRSSTATLDAVSPVTSRKASANTWRERMAAWYVATSSVGAVTSVTPKSR